MFINMFLMIVFAVLLINFHQFKLIYIFIYKHKFFLIAINLNQFKFQSINLILCRLILFECYYYW